MALVLLNLDLTVVNLALPILGRRFHSSLATLQWVNNIYSLTFAALVVFAGKIADRHGHKKIYLFGICFFFLGSLIAGLAPNIATLIIGRFFQGVGMAGTFGMIFILANAAFPPEQRSIAIGLLVVFVGLAQALGPTIGGLIVEHLGWRYAFYINLPFCLLSFILVIFACQKDKLNPQTLIHYLSGVLLIIAYSILVFTFNESKSWGFLSFQFLSYLAVGIIVFIVTLFWQRKLKSPFLDLSLFRSKTYSSVSIIRLLFQFNFGAFFFILPIYLQNIIGMSPAQTGTVMLIMTAPLALCSSIIGKVNKHLKPQITIAVSQSMATIGFIIFALLPISPINWWWFSIALVCIGVNVGMIYATTNYAIISSLPDDKKGVGYGFFSANAYFFYSIGVALAGSLISIIGQSHFQSLLITTFGKDSHLIANAKLSLYASGAQPIHNLLQLHLEHGKTIMQLAKQSFAMGFSVIMWLFAIISIITLLLCL